MLKTTDDSGQTVSAQAFIYKNIGIILLDCFYSHGEFGVKLLNLSQKE